MTKVSWDSEPIEALARYAEDWDRIVNSYYGDHPLLSCRFLVPLVKHYATSDDRLLLGRRADGQMGCMALISPGSLGRISSFSPSQLPITPWISDRLAEYETSALLELGSTSLTFYRYDPRYLGNLPDSLPIEIENYGNTICVDTKGTFDEYWGARNKSLRKDLRQNFNRLEKDGLRFRFQAIAEPSEIEAAVNRYAQLESAGWKGEEGTALGPGDAQSAFYTDVLSRFAAGGHASIYELTLGDELAASRMCVRSDAMLVILKTTFSESLARYSPGKTQLYLLLKGLFDDSDLNVVEFYTDANAQALAWASEDRYTKNASMYRSILHASAVRAIRKARSVIG